MSSQGSYGNQPTWIPYITSKDCSQGLCSLYCRQNCYTFILPPPPPFDFPEVNRSSPNFSPLVIAVIGILASAFILVSYYTLISKFCGNNHPPTTRQGDQERAGSHGPGFSEGGSTHEPWFVPANGLDEAVIRSITVCKYKKGVGLIEGTCSVCLSEFDEDETIRLLPKCTHPFHIPCIDTWLRSHPNCPLCRSDIVFTDGVFPVMLPHVPENSHSFSHQSSESRAETEDSSERTNTNIACAPSMDSRELDGSAIIEVREEGLQPMRRSLSTGHCCQRQTVSDVLRMNDDEESQLQDSTTPKNPSEMCHAGVKGRPSDCAKSLAETMKRSYSSGRLTVARFGRSRERF